MYKLKPAYFPYLCLAILAIPLFFLNIHDQHNWGDDFSQYIKEALNLAHGKPYYQSGYIYNAYNTEYAPPQYPPGFPLLLAPVVKLWGLSFRAMFYFNSCVAVCLLFALYGYFRRYAGVVASICIALLITYSGFMIDIKQQVLSDVPCLLFVTLYLGMRSRDGLGKPHIILMVLLGTMAVLTRSQAMVLLAAELLFFFYTLLKTTIREKRLTLTLLYTLPSLWIISGVVLLRGALNKTVFYSPLSTGSFYNHFIDVTLHKRLIEVAESNIAFLLRNIPAFFHYETPNAIVSGGIFYVECMAVTFCFIGFVIKILRSPGVDDFFFVLMCLMVLFLPIHDQRYFLPVIPIIYLYCFTAFKAIAPLITTIRSWKLAIGATALYLLAGAVELKKAFAEKPQYLMPKAKDLEAFEYIKKHVPDTDIIVFTKPRLLTLFTEKKCINTAWQVSLQKNKEILDSFGVRYMLVLDGLDDGYYKTYLKEVGHPVDSVQIAEGYKLYSLK